MPDQVDHQHMLECEARYWLRRGNSTPERVAELEEVLAKKRGATAVERLIEEMRRQWARRREWLGGGNSGQ